MRDRIELIVPHGGKEREEKRWWEQSGSNEDINVSRDDVIGHTGQC